MDIKFIQRPIRAIFTIMAIQDELINNVKTTSGYTTLIICLSVLGMIILLAVVAVIMIYLRKKRTFSALGAAPPSSNGWAGKFRLTGIATTRNVKLITAFFIMSSMVKMADSDVFFPVKSPIVSFNSTEAEIKRVTIKLSVSVSIDSSPDGNHSHVFKRDWLSMAQSVMRVPHYKIMSTTVVEFLPTCTGRCIGGDAGCGYCVLDKASSYRYLWTNSSSQMDIYKGILVKTNVFNMMLPMNDNGMQWLSAMTDLLIPRVGCDMEGNHIDTCMVPHAMVAPTMTTHGTFGPDRFMVYEPTSKGPSEHDFRMSYTYKGRSKPPTRGRRSTVKCSGGFVNTVRCDGVMTTGDYDNMRIQLSNQVSKQMRRVTMAVSEEVEVVVSDINDRFKTTVSHAATTFKQIGADISSLDTSITRIVRHINRVETDTRMC